MLKSSKKVSFQIWSAYCKRDSCFVALLRPHNDCSTQKLLGSIRKHMSGRVLSKLESSFIGEKWFCFHFFKFILSLVQPEGCCYSEQKTSVKNDGFTEQKPYLENNRGKKCICEVNSLSSQSFTLFCPLVSEKKLSIL